MRKPISKNARNAAIIILVTLIVVAVISLAQEIPAPMQDIEKDIPYGQIKK